MKSPPGPARLKFCATWAHNSTIYNTLQLTLAAARQRRQRQTRLERQRQASAEVLGQ